MCNAINGQNVIQLFDKQRSISHLRAGQSESLKINKSSLNSLIANRPQSFDCTFPGQKSRQNLQKYALLSKGFYVSDDKGQKYFPQSDIMVYHSSDANELITLVIYEEQVSIFYSDESGNHSILPTKGESYTHLIEESFIDENFDCKVIEDQVDQKVNRSMNKRSATENECVDIYLEIDHRAYLNKGSSIPNTTTWAINLMAQVALQFNRVKIPLKISGIKIFTSVDPYVSLNDSTTNNMEQTLYEFRDSMNRQGFNGRLAHLLCGRSIGGGIAYLGSLCSNFTNVAVSGNLNSGVTAYPTYSWNVNVIAHELGHNFGSSHTHDCVWNGNNTAIDGCRAPNGCPSPPQPPSNIGGTIMSYCHLTGSGINPKNGFGPQPGALIYERFSNATCELSADCSGTPPVNDLCFSAISLYSNLACNIYESKISDANPSNGISNSACNANNTLPDVWFTTILPASGITHIETKQIDSGTEDLILEIYKGDCFGLTYYSCDDDGGDGNHAKVSLSDHLLYGDTIYIRVINKSLVEGNFGICIQNDNAVCDSLVLQQLKNFYNALGGNSWTNNTGWATGIANNNCDYCSWYGVQCDEIGNITAITLPGNNLTGTLADTLGLPFSIKNLNLSNNFIDGKLPQEWDSLKILKFLDLSNNDIQDTLPNFYKDHQKLCMINLSHNGFYGSLPLYTGYIPSLISFDVSDNQLEGCFESSLFNLCSKTLNLSQNQQLVYGGNTVFFCQEFSGVDGDQDGFCKDFEDCNDSNNKVYPNAPEICDNLDNDCNSEVDEGVGGTNINISPTSVWTDSTKWSLGHPPLPCEIVIIGDGTNPTTVNLTGGYVELNTITLAANATLNVQLQANISIVGGPSIINHGNINVFGGLYQYSQDSTFGIALENFGNVTVETTGNLNFSTANLYYILNHPGAMIRNKNYFGLSMYDKPPTYGIYNMGSIINDKNFSIYGIHNVPYLVLSNNAIMQNKPTGNINFSYSRSSIGSIVSRPKLNTLNDRRDLQLQKKENKKPETAD
ncbi:MAG TPA: M12 family metallo-peptidase [Saprospiraceae bacterium]|nr:M12 family metallo-peptidase [Saprospiraceae bacterium]